MIPRAIVHRQKSAAGLKAALKVHGAEAAEGVARQLEQETSPDLPLPDLEGFQLLLRKRLERARRELLSADEVHQREKLRLRELRRERDAAKKDLRRLVHRLRFCAEAAYGVGTSHALLALDGPTPRDPVVLSGAVKRSLRQLRQQLEGGPPPALQPLPGTRLEPAAWIPLLEEPLGRLDFALHRIARQKQVVTRALVFKDRAQAEYDELEGTTRRMLQEIYRYAGLGEMAGSLQPRRRKGRSAQAVEGAAVQEPEMEEPETAEEASRPRLVLVPTDGDPAATPRRGSPPREDGTLRSLLEPAAVT